MRIKIGSTEYKATRLAKGWGFRNMSLAGRMRGSYLWCGTTELHPSKEALLQAAEADYGDRIVRL